MSANDANEHVQIGLSLSVYRPQRHERGSRDGSKGDGGLRSRYTELASSIEGNNAV